MYARVVTWENGSQADIDRLKQSVEAGDGPPPGVPAKGITVLVDRESGRNPTITFFETEDDLRTGHEALDQMTPPGDSAMRRASVEFYDVPIDARL